MDVGHTMRDGRTWEIGEDTGEISRQFWRPRRTERVHRRRPAPDRHGRPVLHRQAVDL